MSSTHRLPSRTFERCQKAFERKSSERSRLESGLMGNIKKLRQADFGYRLRMGDYRILFDVEDDTIVIQKIGHRKDIYE
jgi:mRNA interferase RelE/StbE